MVNPIGVKLSYDGEDASEHQLDFYDVAQGLIGFQRSLALTTHLVLNDEVITQAPFLRGAKIAALPPSRGSWELLALISLLGAGLYKLGTTPKDSPIGHLVLSAYDYVLSHSVGVHADYSKSIGQLVEEKHGVESIGGVPSVNQLDSLAEKCETAIIQIHRPIVKSETASHAKIMALTREGEIQIGPLLNSGTYEYISYTTEADSPSQIYGLVSSYNKNTFKGRIFVKSHGRPIPFQLAESTRDQLSVESIAESLSLNIQTNGRIGEIGCVAYEHHSRTGQLKRYLIVDVGGLEARQ